MIHHTDERIQNIEEALLRAATLASIPKTPVSCLSYAESDCVILAEEVERLRAELDAESARHEFTCSKWFSERKELTYALFAARAQSESDRQDQVKRLVKERMDAQEELAKARGALKQLLSNSQCSEHQRLIITDALAAPRPDSLCNHDRPFCHDTPGCSRGEDGKKCGHGPEMLKVVDLYCAQCVEEEK